MISGRSTPRPVIVGVAQIANKDSARLVSPLTLVREAVELAARDAGGRAGAALTSRIDAVYCPPASVFAERTLAEELGDAYGVVGPRQTAGFSGAGPLTLLAAACEAIVAGAARVALLAGAVAEASVKRARDRGIEPLAPQAAAWSQGSSGRREYEPDEQMRRAFTGAEVGAGVMSPTDIFALLESSFAAAAGRDPEQQRAWLGTVMQPFTQVAATRPDVAWFPVIRDARELSTVDANNRMIAEPYPKLMNSFPTVDLAAAVFVTTEEVADELGIDASARVYPWASGHCREVAAPSGRPVMHESRALAAAAAGALRGAGLGVDDITAFDLYSCFPAAVQLCARALGIALDDARGLTLTGGLPYFGGPGANYVTHAIVAAVERCRTSSQERALVVGVGGAPSDFAATVFAAEPPVAPWQFDRCPEMAAVLTNDRVLVDNARPGLAVVDAMTVLHDRVAGPVFAPVVARHADGTRTGARAIDDALVRSLAGVNLVGRHVRLIERGDGVVYDVI